MQAAIYKIVDVYTDLDIIIARLRAREVAASMGFGTMDQARISMTAGELARVFVSRFNELRSLHISSLEESGKSGVQLMIEARPKDSQNTTVKELTPQEHRAIDKATTLMGDGQIEVNTAVLIRVILIKWLK